jgi:hypothetical protein
MTQNQSFGDFSCSHVKEKLSEKRSTKNTRVLVAIFPAFFCNDVIASFF